MKKASDSSHHPERRQHKGRRAHDPVLPDFRDMIDNAAQGILVHDHFKPLYANKAFARLFGYEASTDIMALHQIWPLLPSEIWEQAEANYEDLMRGEAKKTAFSRIRGLKRNGAELWLSLTERVIDWYGKRAVQINVFDISEQMAIEQLMLNNEQLLRAMLEILPVPIYIARRSDGRMLFVNRKTCLLFQQSAGPLLRSRSTDYFVNPQDRENLRDMVEDVGDIREVEVKMRTAQGREFTAELAAIIIDHGGEPAVLVALNDISQRKKLEAELFHQASFDALTGISNRRYFLLQAEQEMRRAKRFARDLSVMMIDLDHFKPINDKYGHAVGDAVLVGVVKTSLESLRQSDVMGRLGGEEFAVILPETGLAAAMDVANRLRAHIADHPIVTVKTAVTCTASIGVAQMKPEDGTIDDLLHRADDAMYRAKEHGRNRVDMAE